MNNENKEKEIKKLTKHIMKSINEYMSNNFINKESNLHWEANGVKIICDETTNTKENIEQNQLCCRIEMDPNTLGGILAIANMYNINPVLIRIAIDLYYNSINIILTINKNEDKNNIDIKNILLSDHIEKFVTRYKKGLIKFTEKDDKLIVEYLDNEVSNE